MPIARENIDVFLSDLFKIVIDFFFKFKQIDYQSQLLRAVTKNSSFVPWSHVDFSQFRIPRSVLTKISTKHEIDHISITAEWILTKFASK